MDRVINTQRFKSSLIPWDETGSFGQKMTCEVDGEFVVVAKVLFWEAQGQFSVETMGDVPLMALEELIVEAKALISD